MSNNSKRTTTPTATEERINISASPLKPFSPNRHEGISISTTPIKAFPLGIPHAPIPSSNVAAHVTSSWNTSGSEAYSGLTPTNKARGSTFDQNRQQRALSTRKTKQFLVFVKILFKCLDKWNNYKLKLQAKAIVVECIRRNRMRDPNFTPLKEAIEHRLRGLVGEVYWSRVHLVIQSLRSRKIKAQNPFSLNSSTPHVLSEEFSPNDYGYLRF